MEEQRFMHCDYHWKPKQEMKSNEMRNGEIEMEENEDIDLKKN